MPREHILERQIYSYIYLHGVLVGEEVDDLQGVLDDASRHELLTAVAALAHQGAAKALHDRALRDSETYNTDHQPKKTAPRSGNQQN